MYALQPICIRYAKYRWMVNLYRSLPTTSVLNLTLMLKICLRFLQGSKPHKSKRNNIVSKFNNLLQFIKFEIKNKLIINIVFGYFILVPGFTHTYLKSDTFDFWHFTSSLGTGNMKFSLICKIFQWPWWNAIGQQQCLYLLHFVWQVGIIHQQKSIVPSFTLNFTK